MSTTKRAGSNTKKAAAKKVAAKKLPKMKEAAKKVAVKKVATKNLPVVENGLTFPDPGFHIAVLGALLDKKALRAGHIQASLEGLDFDDEASETERLLAAMARLHAIKLDPKKVARIEALDFDGGNEIYMLLEDGAGVETGGEDDTYSLQAITGIGALSGLKKLRLDGHGYRAETLDLKPLEGHPALEFLQLSGKCKSAKTLESLPKLAHVDLLYASVDRPAVLDRLAKRGVEIVRPS